MQEFHTIKYIRNFHEAIDYRPFSTIYTGERITVAGGIFSNIFFSDYVKITKTPYATYLEYIQGEQIFLDQPIGHGFSSWEG